jgi:ELWxxDGT repeat protein
MSRDRRLPRIARAALLALLLAPPRAAAAQQAHLVADLNVTPGGASSEPRDLLRAGDTVYFSAADAAHGRELWKTDGTAAGTVLVKDLAPGPAAGSPRGFTMLHETLFFFADDPTNGTALWRSNGTALGTELVRAVTGGAPFADGHMREAGDVLFFLGGDAGDPSLWRSDGTAAHTDRVTGPWADGYALLPDGDVDPMALGNALLFITVDAATDRARLWRTVGTEASTSEVMAVDPGMPGQGRALSRLARLGDAVYFTANDGGTWGLYRTDGTAAGTTFVGPTPGQPDGLTAVNGMLLFQLTYSGASCPGCPILVRSDGTAAGSGAVDLNPISVDTTRRPPFVASGGGVFFGSAVETPSLWTTDGTALKTYAVQPLSGFPASAESVDLDGILYFTAYRPPSQEAFRYEGVVWRSDGTAQGTAPVSTRPDAAFLTPLGPRLLFQGTDDAHGAELWRSDGTDEGTVLLRDIASGGQGSDPTLLTGAGGSLFFLADDGVHGRALWKADGAARGATLAVDFTPFPGTGNPGSGQIDWLALLGDGVLFPRVGAGDAYEMWAADAAGPRQVGSFAWNMPPMQLRATSAGVAPLAPSRGVVYIHAPDAAAGQGEQLWRCDGVSTAVVWTTDGWFGAGASAGSHLYFSVIGGAGGIFRSDGTKEGTQRIADAADTVGFVVANERVFFLDGLDLFVIDDSVAAPRHVATIPTQDLLLRMSFPQAALGNAVFGVVPSAYGGDATYALWKSDGSKEGTFAIGALPGAPSSPLVASAGQLFFTVSDAGAGTAALWVSDGTASGTRALQGAPPNVDGLVPLPGGGVIFAAGDTSVDGLGVEPWISDGTAAGTHALQPIGARGLSSLPDQFTVSGGHVFFTADDGVHGRELWALPWSAPTTPATTCACRAPGQEQRLPGGWLPALAALALAGRRRAARRGARIGVA